MITKEDITLRVLVGEDNAGDSLFIEETLSADTSNPITLSYATTLKKALQQIDELTIDVVLLDLGLPDGHGVFCVETLLRRNRNLPIVVLTGLNDEQMAIDCLKVGAQDYLCKDSALSHNLRQAMNYAIARKKAVELTARSEQLEGENARMQELNQVKSRFIAGMSHELRTPLNAIIGFGEMLRSGIVPYQTKEFTKSIENICTSGKHLLNLVDDILDIAKIESGKLEFRYERASITQLIAEVVDICGPISREKLISISVDIDQHLSDLYLDILRFKQILYNFLSNALKFTHRGGNTFIRIMADGPNHFRLEVQDNGSGIACEELPMLFKEFQQFGQSRQALAKGTGLGLALTKRLVEAQGGTIGAQSVLGAGSIFYAVLPNMHNSVSQSEPARFITTFL